MCVIIFTSVHFHDSRDYTCTKHCDAVLELYAEVKTFLPTTLLVTGWNLLLLVTVAYDVQECIVLLVPLAIDSHSVEVWIVTQRAYHV
jgi:hypothetical protein